MRQRDHLIFLTRKHPDSIGGVQRHSARLIEGMKDSFEVENIRWKGPEWGAPFYFPYFYYKSIRNGASLLHCDDAVTALVGARIRRSSKKKVVATVHGLDIVLPIPWYQRRLQGALAHLDKIVCVSEATAIQVRSRGLPDEKIEVIPNAAEDVENRLDKDESLYREIERQAKIDLRGKRVLFSLGRPLKRKGFDYFIREVFPHLPENCVYIAAGPEPKSPRWLKTVRPLLGKKYHDLLLLASGALTVHDELKNLSRHPRLFYLNGVDEEMRELLFAASDLLIMPNRTVPGDMEGFGIVALEAAIRGVPVVATGIEGVIDAVIHDENGLCVPEGDVAAMVKIIKALLDDPERLSSLSLKAMKYTRTHFSSSVIHGRYEKIFNDLLNGNS